MIQLEDLSLLRLPDLRHSWPSRVGHIYHYTGGLMLIVMHAQMIANNPLISQTDPDAPHLAKSESFVSISHKVLLPFHKTGPEINCNGQNFQRFFPP